MVGVSLQHSDGMAGIRVGTTAPALRRISAAASSEAFASRKPGGMGMGLAICRSVVEAHHTAASRSATARRWAVHNSRCGCPDNLNPPCTSSTTTGTSAKAWPGCWIRAACPCAAGAAATACCRRCASRGQPGAAASCCSTSGWSRCRAWRPSSSSRAMGTGPGRCCSRPATATSRWRSPRSSRVPGTSSKAVPEQPAGRPRRGGPARRIELEAEQREQARIPAGPASLSARARGANRAAGGPLQQEHRRPSRHHAAHGSNSTVPTSSKLRAQSAVELAHPWQYGR